MILLNPGPVNLSPAVRQALTGPDLCHREAEFYALQDIIRSQLLRIYGLDPEAWAAILLAGSGTAVVEAMLTSMVPADGQVLVIENGVYGERMADILHMHRIACSRLSYEWGVAIDSRDIEAALAENPAITHLAVVHHETTTGRLNNLDSIATACRERGVRLLLDGVSSFGAEALNFADDNIAACAATANKCLHGAPGLSFVIANRADLAAGATDRTLYLDLTRYCLAQDQQGTPFTQPVHLYYALNQALEELAADGGWRARHAHYRRLAERVRAGLAARGIEPLLADAESSVILSGYYLPEGINYETLHDDLKARGYIIYAGQGRLQRELFRIAVMGAITVDDIDRLLVAFDAACSRASA